MNILQATTIYRKSRRLAAQLQFSMLALVSMSICPSHALAQDGHSHTPTAQSGEMTAEQQSKASALMKIVRDSTERFKDVSVAVAEGYALQFGCVSGSDSGAMGLHYVNGNLVNSGVLDACAVAGTAAFTAMCGEASEPKGVCTKGCATAGDCACGAR